MDSWKTDPAVKWLEHPSHLRACAQRSTHYAHEIIEQIPDYTCEEEGPHVSCLHSPWFYHPDAEKDHWSNDEIDNEISVFHPDVE